MNSASTMKIIAIALLIAGAGLAFWGYQLPAGSGRNCHRPLQDLPRMRS